MLVHQMNVTLLTVLSHQSPEGQKEAMQHLVQLKMGAADKQVALRAVRPSGRGSHSSTFQPKFSRFGHTSPCPPV